MRATYFAVLMILYTVANIMSVWLGISEFAQLNKLTGLISLVVLSTYYIFMGVWHIYTKKMILLLVFVF